MDPMMAPRSFPSLCCRQQSPADRKRRFDPGVLRDANGEVIGGGDARTALLALRV